MPKGTTKRERAIVRMEGESDVAFLERKLEYAKRVEADKAAAKVIHVNKRISSKQAQIAKLTSELSQLEAERDKLVNGTAEWTEQDHLAAEGKA